MIRDLLVASIDTKFNDETLKVLNEMSRVNRGIAFIKESNLDLSGIENPVYVSSIFNRIDRGNYSYSNVSEGAIYFKGDLSKVYKKVITYSKGVEDTIRFFTKYAHLSFDCLVYVEGKSRLNKYEPKFSDNKLVITINQDNNTIKSVLGGYNINMDLVYKYLGGK